MRSKMVKVAGVVETVRQVHSGDVRAEDSCAAAIERADAMRELNAIRVVDRERAWQQAECVAARIRRGEKPPLAGVPMVIKDNVAWKGMATHAGRIADGTPLALTDAVIVQRLEQAGAILIGRANMDELAYGVTGANAHTGQIHNPWRQDCHTGGSSGGSAAAVAAGIVPAAIGTDTVGSIRIPASLCGVAGLKPTHELCPGDGVAPLARTLDSVGPLARSVEDLALVLSVAAADTSLCTLGSEHELDGIRVLALQGKFPVEIDLGVQDLFASALRVLEQLGMKVERGNSAAFEHAPRIAGPIVGAEAAAAWAGEFEQHPHRFGDEVAGHLRKGLSMTEARYQRALEDRLSMTREIDCLFDRFDLVVLPSTATSATPWRSPGPQLAFLGLTAAFSLTGHPACSVPMGTDRGLPVGLQIAARRRCDGMLLRAAAAFERLSLVRTTLA